MDTRVSCLFLVTTEHTSIISYLRLRCLNVSAHYVSHSLRRSKLDLCHLLQCKLKIAIEMCHFNEINVSFTTVCPNAVNFFYIVGDLHIISI